MPATASAQRRGLTTTDIALIATFAALVVVCSVSAALPIGVNGVPLTLQTFAVLLCGAVLGATRGFLAVLLYLVVGAAGLPIFAGGAAGLAPFAGPTAGYLLAFPFAAAVIGFTVERVQRHQIAITAGVVIASGLVAEILITLAGATSIAAASHISFAKGVGFAMAYVPGDLVKLVIAGIVAAAVHRAFPQLLAQRA